VNNGRPSLVLVPQYFGSLLFDRRSSRYLPFDGDATRVLRALLDRPVDDVVSNADDPDAASAFASFLMDRGFLRMDGRLAASLLAHDDVPLDHLLGPLAVHLEVIGACNLTCTHCFAGTLPRNHDPLTLHEMEALFGELASIGSFRLGLTGGEPLMRRDILDILDAATGAGLHPCITTNALLIDQRMARELGRRDLVWLNVSLEGAVAATNDAVRGAGVYDAVLEKLALLREHARFTLAFTLTQNNVAEVEACARLAQDVGAHTAVFRPLYPVGTAAHHADAMMPTFAQYTDALSRLSCAPASNDLFALDPFSPSAREELRATVMPLADEGCGAGNSVASINIQGRVSPCSFLGAAFEDGDIRASSFSAIWRRGHTFARLRAHDERDAFRGGCRARAQHYAGSAYAPDPWQQAHDGVAPPNAANAANAQNAQNAPNTPRRGALRVLNT
jgi:MoaA/NifB/PqqE/SkfB family radical SAM enzyme